MDTSTTHAQCRRYVGHRSGTRSSPRMEQVLKDQRAWKLATVMVDEGGKVMMSKEPNDGWAQYVYGYEVGDLVSQYVESCADRF